MKNLSRGTIIEYCLDANGGYGGVRATLIPEPGAPSLLGLAGIWPLTVRRKRT